MKGVKREGKALAKLERRSKKIQSMGEGEAHGSWAASWYIEVKGEGGVICSPLAFQAELEVV